MTRFEKGDHIVGPKGQRLFVDDATFDGYYYVREVRKGRLAKNAKFVGGYEIDNIFEKVVSHRVKKDRKRPTSALSPKIKRRNLRL